MIRREGVAVATAPSVPPTPAGTHARALTMRRTGRWIAEKGWVHVLLLTAIAVCLYPFVWMFMTSIKTDEELAQASMAPAIPAFVPESPYVRGEAKVERPQDAPEATFAAALPTLRDLTQAKV